jgi:WD40 repeat protein
MVIILVNLAVPMALLCIFIFCCCSGTIFRYLATASADHTVKIWNVDGFKLERTLIGTVLYFENFEFKIITFLFFFFLKLITL